MIFVVCLFVVVFVLARLQAVIGSSAITVSSVGRWCPCPCPGRCPRDYQGICLVIARFQVRCPVGAFCCCCFLGQETLLPLPQPPSCLNQEHIVCNQGTAEKQLHGWCCHPCKKKNLKKKSEMSAVAKLYQIAVCSGSDVAKLCHKFMIVFLSSQIYNLMLIWSISRSPCSGCPWVNCWYPPAVQHLANS